MKKLNRKLLRELLRLWGQMLAVAAVVACGISVFVSMNSVRYSLIASKDKYYSQCRFGDIFLQAKRAPEYLLTGVRNIDGVASADSRIVSDVTIDVPGLHEPATGRLISIPEHRSAVLNDVYLRRGRYIDPQRPEEVIVSEAFATAGNLVPGDSVGAVINGRWKALRIVGIGLSPEYIYEVQPGAFFPDNKRFGVFWMGRKSLAAAFGMTGAFNDLSLTLAHGASEKEVIRKLDQQFAAYGSLGAYGRDEQLSDRFISDEIKQVGMQVTVLPAMFLGVAVFLLNIVLRRLVTTQRDQIAVLKAVGYSNEDVGLHYLGFALIPVAFGALAGTALGAWLGSRLMVIYARFYHFPELIYIFRSQELLISVLFCTLAALGGALIALRQAVTLPPAEAMRPESPILYRAGFFERFRFQKQLPVTFRIILRNIERKKWKAAISMFMISLAVAILIAGRFSYDSVRYMTTIEFTLKHREDVTVIFNTARPLSVQYELTHLQGVLQQEFYREEPVRMRFNHRTKRISLTGLKSAEGLRRLVDSRSRQYRLPESGILLTRTFADIMGVGAGDTLEVDFLQGRRRTARVPVAGTIDELIGLSAYIDRDQLDRLAGDGGVVNAAYLRIDADKSERLYSTFKKMPEIAGTMMLKAMKESFDKLLAESMNTTTVILTAFACTLAFAVVYNGARISLSERARELSSLRVIGLTKAEIAVILLGEQVLLTLAAIPLGYGIGVLLSMLLAKGLSSEMYRMPLYFSSENFFFATGVIMLVTAATSLLILRRLNRLDLIAVLKTRE